MEPQYSLVDVMFVLVATLAAGILIGQAKFSWRRGQFWRIALELFAGVGTFLAWQTWGAVILAIISLTVVIEFILVLGRDRARPMWPLSAG